MQVNYTFNPANIAPDLLPNYATEGSAAFDLRADIENVLIATPFELLEIPTGVKIAVPAGHVGFIAVRSSLAKRGLIAANAIGVIDSDYRGELVLIVRNNSLTPLVIQPAERLAQFVILPIVAAELKQLTANEFSKHTTERGAGGFGSTGNF